MPLPGSKRGGSINCSAFLSAELSFKSWRRQVPHQGHEPPENGVGQGENPDWKVIVDHLRKPKGNERFSVAAAFAERVFPRCQRADRAQPSLQCNKENSSGMERAEPGIATPAPVAEKADDHQEKTHDHADDEGEMNDHEHAGQKFPHLLFTPAPEPRSPSLKSGADSQCLWPCALQKPESGSPHPRRERRGS